MLRIMLVFCSSLYLFASELPFVFNGDIPPSRPLRRAPAMVLGLNVDLEQYPIGDRLVMMVSYFSLPRLAINENRIVELIMENPNHANLYSGIYEAYLITLACRNDLRNVVGTIIDNDQSALSCFSAGHTPLDEEIQFQQREIAQYLFDRSASMCTTTNKQLQRLLQR